MSIESSGALLQVFKALADESRLRIVGLLAVDERSVDELAAHLGLKAPTISHHLATLKNAGLVAMRPAGTTHLYRFLPERLRQLNRELAPERLAITETVVGDAWERKVLDAFLEPGAGPADPPRIKAVPAGERKRLVLLRWLADRFEPHRRYPEPEVNILLALHHPDYASWRRYLVDSGLMDRGEGVYWRREEDAS